MIVAEKFRLTGIGEVKARCLLAGVLVAALVAIIALAVSQHRTVSAPAKFDRKPSTRVVPPDVVPEVEPTRFRSMPREQARTFNASIPFSTDPNPPARPFRFTGTDEDRSRAQACLAAAVLYEAGDDLVGERAVAQIVLNRTRHPAFPKTVCGVVFQGSERQTGCQFTFTCDGALNRSYSDAAWDRAGKIAAAALSGVVFKPVGYATHYHTDWVVPYWSSSLDKIAAVKTHLFFRWTGWWGTPPAFRFMATGNEPRIVQLGARFAEHRPPSDTDALLAIEGMDPGVSVATGEKPVKPTPGDTNVFFVALLEKDEARFPAIAAQVCGARPYCKFTGWTNPANVPQNTAIELTPKQIGSMSFTLLRDRATKFERALWNCGQFKHSPEQCMWSSSANLRSEIK